ncbi:MAG: SUMF1/EgtB/PvdO family nonheme iron enzyme [Pseudomonadales bacterium]|nr:SUMF1/EgtB/PvdO family nonheme iron enzyme [Pseudomonadales bacterium]
MNPGNGNGSASDHDQPIRPLDYTPPAAVSGAAMKRPGRRETSIAAALIVALLALWFLFSARAVEIHTVPAGTERTIEGGAHLAFGSHLLLRPGDYRLSVSAKGYATRQLPLVVGAARDQRLEVTLEKLPGLLLLTTKPVPARVLIDDVDTGYSNAAALRVSAGTHRLRLEADRFLPREQTLEIEGMEIEQGLALDLEPGWGSYQVQTQPAGASILLDETQLGVTPAEVELLAGRRTLRLQLAGFADAALSVEASAGERRELPAMTLHRADALLRISSRPSGASVTVDGVFRGSTPLELALDSSTAHELIAFKAGYERASRKLVPGAGAEQQLALELRPITGEVHIEVKPADAQIFSGERLLGKGSQTLQLPSSAQELNIRHIGYASETLRVTPRPGFPQTLNVNLRTVAQQKLASLKTRITTGIGQELVLLRPGNFSMGSSRREAGRRANEALREVQMQRPFYLGVAEVSNGEFRKYRAAHSSGNFKGKSLNGDDQPASLLSWDDAALFCNWLSKRDGLAVFYRTAGNTVTGFDPASPGYRLPSEAEWAWAASVQPGGTNLRFSWGATLPPPPKAGNFADQSGASLLGDVIAGYDDGFPVSSPRKRFTPNRHGLFDMSGNAAEWVNDYYEAVPGTRASDPLGPEIGEFHVIRGASWRHGGITELRLAFRDYGKDARADVGFRLARYLE